MKQAKTNAPDSQIDHCSRNPFPPLSDQWWQFLKALYGPDLEGPMDEDLAWGSGPKPFNAACLLILARSTLNRYNVDDPDFSDHGA